ncbi:CPBP family intramembrane glutamic endopeptidase [Suicoccus acidiformans]|nr:type II CAAX endopeptidase family protein [Suicoccus acidiformans]
MEEKDQKLDVARFFILTLLPQIITVIFTLILIPVSNFFDEYGIVQTALVLPISFIVVPYIFLKHNTNADISLKNMGLRDFKCRDYIMFIFSIVIVTLTIYWYRDFKIEILYFGVQTLIIAICEEIWARGMLIHELRNGGLSGFWCVVISSLIFAFITHQNRPITDNLINRFPGALLMGYLYYRTKKIEIPILIHFVNNMIGGM